jgi:cysteine desulfurase/selenocysteine lyase
MTTSGEFSGLPGPGAALPGALYGAGTPVTQTPGPSAARPSAGGVSTGNTAPPTPGVLQAPPIASAPPLKESDLRSMVALAAEQLGLPATAFAVTPSAAQGVPPNVHGGGFPSPFSLEKIAGVSAPALPASPFSAAPAFGDQSFAPPDGFPGSFHVPLFGETPLPEAPAAVPAAPADVTSVYVPNGLAAADDPPAPVVRHGAEFRPDVVPEVRGTRDIFDPISVKRDFPILQERVHGKPLVWLDNAATTQKPRAVIERLAHFYEHENSNIHRAAHTLAARSTDAYEGARDKVRRFIGAPSPDTIVFTRGATEAINLVAKSWGARHLSAGDEIVITWLEHHANIVPWQQLAAEKGVVLKVAPVDDRGVVDLDAFERLLGRRTRLVSMTQVSNALGTIVPVTEMTRMAHRYGACVLVDGAQAVSHAPVDVQAIDCDFYVFSGHKVFAPTGIGALYGKREVLESMPPWQGGGNMISDVRFEKTTYQPPPARFEAGTGNIGDAVGLGAALDYVTNLGIQNIARYEHELLEYGTECLLTVPGLRLIGTAPDKAGVLSFVVKGLRTEDMSAALDKEGIAVRSGHHCAQPILRRFGLESTVRASLAPYNTKDDIDALVAALHRIRAASPSPP